MYKLSAQGGYWSLWPNRSCYLKSCWVHKNRINSQNKTPFRFCVWPFDICWCWVQKCWEPQKLLRTEKSKENLSVPWVGLFSWWDARKTAKLTLYPLISLSSSTSEWDANCANYLANNADDTLCRQNSAFWGKYIVCVSRHIVLSRKKCRHVKIWLLVCVVSLLHPRLRCSHLKPLPPIQGKAHLSRASPGCSVLILFPSHFAINPDVQRYIPGSALSSEDTDIMFEEVSKLSKFCPICSGSVGCFYGNILVPRNIAMLIILTGHRRPNYRGLLLLKMSPILASVICGPQKLPFLMLTIPP